MIKRICACLLITTMCMAGTLSFGEELTPQTTVSNYYNALKGSEFEKAVDYISKGMQGDKTKEQWANDCRKTFELGKATITGFSVSPGTIEGDTATVRTEIRSSDRFNPQGITENEIDYLVKEDGVWKIDRTEVELPSI